MSLDRDDRILLIDLIRHSGEQLTTAGIELGRARGEEQLVRDREPNPIDDALDFDASPDELGKNLGDDLAEGKATLPLIYAMQHGNAAESELIRNAILEGGLDDLERIQSIIESTGALQYTAARAQEAAEVAIGALSGIPGSDYKQALVAIAEFSVRRRS